MLVKACVFRDMCGRGSETAGWFSLRQGGPLPDTQGVNVLGFVHPARWLVVLLTILVLLVAPTDKSLMSLVVLAASVVMGFCEQGARLGDLAPRLRLVGDALAIAVLLGAFFVKLEWVLRGNSDLLVVLFALSGMSGFLCGAFIASLRSKRIPTSLSTRDLLSQANELTVLRAGTSEHDERRSQSIEPRAVDVFTDGRWQRATLDAWETRDLNLFGHVRVHESNATEWVSADRLRVVPIQ